MRKVIDEVIVEAACDICGRKWDPKEIFTEEAWSFTFFADSDPTGWDALCAKCAEAERKVYLDAGY